ncbi:MAG: hypothetical protein KC431_07600 [Myxococcales bacterium]|nr:hypothetical protein [Myxococcales bacterium]
MNDEATQQARYFVREHLKQDPAIVAVYIVPGTDELRMVEVSGSVDTVGEVIPFGFGKQPSNQLPLDTILVLISEEEYASIKRGDLDLPDGWGSVDNLVEIPLREVQLQSSGT